MKWRVRKPMARYRRLHWWHTWFAWYPVRVPSVGGMSGMTMVWMQRVERKGKSFIFLGRLNWAWAYRLKEQK